MGHHRSLPIATLSVVGAVVAACGQASGTTTAPTSAPSALATVVATAAPTTAAQPTSGMMAAGTFHNVDGTASGEAQLIVTPAGDYEVVLESFKIASIASIHLVLVSNPDVTKSSDVDPSKLLDLGPLTAEEGMLDFPIPANMSSSVMETYHTVVLWDTEMAHAIAAAPLR